MSHGPDRQPSNRNNQPSDTRSATSANNTIPDSFDGKTDYGFSHRIIYLTDKIYQRSDTKLKEYNDSLYQARGDGKQNYISVLSSVYDSASNNISNGTYKNVEHFFDVGKEILSEYQDNYRDVLSPTHFHAFASSEEKRNYSEDIAELDHKVTLLRTAITRNFQMTGNTITIYNPKESDVLSFLNKIDRQVKEIGVANCFERTLLLYRLSMLKGIKQDKLFCCISYCKGDSHIALGIGSPFAKEPNLVLDAWLSNSPLPFASNHWNGILGHINNSTNFSFSTLGLGSMLNRALHCSGGSEIIW